MRDTNIENSMSAKSLNMLFVVYNVYVAKMSLWDEIFGKYAATLIMI